MLIGGLLNWRDGKHFKRLGSSHYFFVFVFCPLALQSGFWTLACEPLAFLRVIVRSGWFCRGAAGVQIWLRDNVYGMIASRFDFQGFALEKVEVTGLVGSFRGKSKPMFSAIWSPTAKQWNSSFAGDNHFGCWVLFLDVLFFNFMTLKAVFGRILLCNFVPLFVFAKKGCPIIGFNLVNVIFLRIYNRASQPLTGCSPCFWGLTEPHLDFTRSSQLAARKYLSFMA